MRWTTWGRWALCALFVAGISVGSPAVMADEGLGISGLGQPVSSEELGNVSIGNSLFAVTDVSQDSTISDSGVSADNGGTVRSGNIHGNSVYGNSGMTTVFNNTGNLVNMTQSTVFNIFLNSGVSSSN